jgi:Ca2+-binding EF-hand superfamily protein
VIISVDEKHQCNLIFEAIDSGNRGSVDRWDFVHYLRDFGSRETLRKIWQSTSDHNSSIGHDEFAIAMHLLEINQETNSLIGTRHIIGTPGSAERLDPSKLLNPVASNNG